MNEIIKVCAIHGELDREHTRRDSGKFRCKACRVETNKKSYYKHREKRVSTAMRWKEQNRGDYNEWCKQDRKKNPEKYRRYERAYKEKQGIENVRKKEVARIHGLTVQQYDELMDKYNNICAVCKLPEKRLGRDGKTLTPLCIDHCHKCEGKGKHVIRGLLCHACNSAIGKLKDNIETVKNIISYLESHACIE